MDRPPPLKRSHSDSESESDLISQPSRMNYSFIPSFNSLMPDLSSSFYESKLTKRKKFTDSFQINSVFPSQQTSLFSSVKAFLQALDSDDLLPSLSTLATELSIAQEPVLLSIPMAKVIEGLLRCLNLSESDVIILAMNSIITLIEVAPHYAQVLVGLGALNIIVPKIANPEYIDVAEKAIRIIEKVSKYDPNSVLSQEIFQIAMETVDFYEIETQKVIFNIGINLILAVTSADFGRIAGSKAFLKVFSYLDSPLGDKTLEFVAIFVEKVQQETFYFKTILDQRFFEALGRFLSSTSANQTKVFSIYSNLVKLDMCFIPEIFAPQFSKQIESFLSSGTCSETTESLKIFAQLLENPGLDHLRFEGLLLWASELIIERASVLFYKLLEINEHSLVLNVIEKLFRAISAENGKKFVAGSKFAGFLAETLGRNDFLSIKSCVNIVAELMEKFPEKATMMLVSEGVISRIKSFKLIGEVNKLEKPMQKITGQENLTFSIFSSKRLEKAAEATKNHNENVRKLVKSVKDVLVKCKKFEKNVEKRRNDLKKIAACLESKTHGEQAFKDLLKILDENTLSAYEFSSENLGHSIWKYITCSSSITVVLEILFKLSEKSLSYFESLIRIIIDSIQFLQNDSQINKKKNNFSVQLEYLYSESTEGAYRHPVFLSGERINLMLSQIHTIENLKASLMSINSPHDLNFFVESYRFGSGIGLADYITDMIDETNRKNTLLSSTVEVKLFINNTELENWMSMQDLLHIEPNLSKTPISFSFLHKSTKHFSSEFLETAESVLIYTVKSSQINGLSPIHKLFPYISILKLLYLLNTYLPSFYQFQRYPSSLFECTKLSSIIQSPQPEKIFKPLSSGSNFLFSFQSRLKYFNSFPVLSRRGQNFKAKVNRSKILESCKKLINEVGSGQLEVDYEGELGTGQGPTLEFFALVSEEVRKLNIWIESASGLFPNPDSTDLTSFYFVGQFIGKSIIDHRILDLKLSPIFWKLILGLPILPLDINEIDPSLYNSLLSLQNLQDPSKFHSLEIYFTLPGYQKLLIPNGDSIKVTHDNLNDFISLTIQTLLLNYKAAGSFKEGLEKFISLNDIIIFTSEEMNIVIGGDDFEPWESEMLMKTVVPSHGFVQNSETFKNLLNIMAGFNRAEQRMFVKFITGSPRLPSGGLGGLNPKMTVVKKEDASDGHLPSVMTCQNYLKIPDYSSLDVLRENLMYAMTECSTTFYLS